PGELGLEQLERIDLPERLTALDRETAQRPGDSEGVDTAAGDGRGGLGAGVEDARIRGAVVGGPPEYAPGLGVESDDLFPLLAGAAGGGEPPPAGDDGGAEPDPGLGPPEFLRRVLPRLDGLGRASVPLRTEPLGPVRRGGCEREGDGQSGR